VEYQLYKNIISHPAISMGNILLKEQG